MTQSTPARSSDGNDSRPEQPKPIPKPRSWDKRSKSFQVLPGRYIEQVKTLRLLCSEVEARRPNKRELIVWLVKKYKVKEKTAKEALRSLLKAGVVTEKDNYLELGQDTHYWFESRDDDFLIALIHSRVQFVGEMLYELKDSPRSYDQLRTIAKRKYELAWDSPGQISRRNAWLESSGHVEWHPSGASLLITTAKGRELLSRLKLDSPRKLLEKPTAPTSNQRSSDSEASHASSTEDPETGKEETLREAPIDADALARKLLDDSTDSKNYDRFEIAVREAFEFLGFHAERLGGPGKTDVLLNAQQGEGFSYRVTVDAKTTGSGHLPEQQIKWSTLVEHREMHNADYSLLVGPDPTQDRLLSRARDNRISVISAEDLADLCRNHANTPLGLTDYQELFKSYGAVDLKAIDARADEAECLLALAGKVLATLVEHTSRVGPVTGDQLYHVVCSKYSELFKKEEVEDILSLLSNPLVGATRVTEHAPERRYIPATTPDVCRMRLDNLGRRLVEGPTRKE